MKISKALKLKNKMVSEYADLVNKMVASNSSDEKSKKNYNSKELFNQALLAQTEIIALKTAIHEASAPIRWKIFRIGELKSFVSKFNNMSTAEGIVKNRGYSATTEDVYVVDFTELEKVSLIKGIQAEIESIQEELDSFNATTEVAY
jgi:hypothetical protein